MAEITSENVSIVIPAYAEELRIERTVTELCELARTFPRLQEILIIAEPSGDATAGVARAAAGDSSLVTVCENAGHRGKGFAVREGMMKATGEIIFFMDADLSVPLHYVVSFVNHLDLHPEVNVAIGCRRHPQSVIHVRQHFLREQAGRGFNRVARLLGLTRRKDTQCGFKAFRRDAARSIFSRTRVDEFAFDVEALLIAKKLHLRVEELPVEWINDRDTKFRSFRDGWRSFRDLLRLRIRRDF